MWPSNTESPAVPTPGLPEPAHQLVLGEREPDGQNILPRAAILNASENGARGSSADTGRTPEACGALGGRSPRRSGAWRAWICELGAEGSGHRSAERPGLAGGVLGSPGMQNRARVRGAQRVIARCCLSRLCGRRARGPGSSAAALRPRWERPASRPRSGRAGLAPTPREAQPFRSGQTSTAPMRPPPRGGQHCARAVPTATLQTRQSRVRAEARACGPVTSTCPVNHRRRGHGPEAKDAPC